MAENPDYRELLQLLNEFAVEYLIVGGFAVMKYGEPCYTKDLDVWIHNSLPNCVQVIRTLEKFGAPLAKDGITAETFSVKQVVYQIGIAPVRIDILTEITSWHILWCSGAFHFPARPQCLICDGVFTRPSRRRSCWNSLLPSPKSSKFEGESIDENR